MLIALWLTDFLFKAVCYGVLGAFLYFIVWERIIKMYYIYWYYRRQGIPCVGFPLPVVGNLLIFLKVFKSMHKYSKTPLEEYFTMVFGEGGVPPIFLDMRDPRGIIVVTDPTYVDDLYIGKNKFFDKADKDKDTYYQWFGDSIFLSRSDQHWHQSRKHLSAAFYKDKMNLLLRTIMSVTNDRVQQWRSTFAQPSEVQDGPGHVEMSLTKEISDMLVDSMLGSVFGMRSVSHTLTLGYYGQMFDVTLGRYMKIISGRFFSRIYHPMRQLFDMFDRWNLNADERENWDNLERLRTFVKKIINDRKELLEGGNRQAVQGKFDFLSQLLDDSFFRENDQMIMDECLTFIGAATQTSSVLFTNVLYFLLKNPETKEKCMNEIKTKLLPHLPPGTDLTKDTTWHKLMLSEETVDSCPYLLQCIYETLRIDSSATVSTALKVTETVEIKDKMIRSDSKILINMQRLHLNPQQWQEPHRFIPDRFNSESPYYLTPAGKKRHPMSFTPFLGGKRVCIGKTFAENVAKSLLPLIMCQIELKIEPSSDIAGPLKPSFSHFTHQPAYSVKVSDSLLLNVSKDQAVKGSE